MGYVTKGSVAGTNRDGDERTIGVKVDDGQILVSTGRDTVVLDRDGAVHVARLLNSAVVEV